MTLNEAKINYVAMLFGFDLGLPWLDGTGYDFGKATPPVPRARHVGRLQRLPQTPV